MGWTLGLALAAVALVAVWRWANRAGGGTAEAAATTTYRIRGRIEVRNDCGGAAAELPDELRVHAVLSDGRTRIEARTEVALEPGPPDAADAPDKVGVYALQVEWPGPSSPGYWDPPRATRPDGSDVCDGLGCERGTRCLNLAGRPRRLALTGPEMEFTLAVTCICVPQ